MSTPKFGGNWTEEKLSRLRKYLHEYLKIFTSNERAQYFKTIYIDAFAGTGDRVQAESVDSETSPLFPEYQEVKELQQGSVKVALSLEKSFNQYLFIDQKLTYTQQLREQIDRSFPERASQVTIQTGDANTLLQTWCHNTDWKKHRAVVFLDPYGMEVEWKTIEALARTKAIDVWIWFPLGQAVNRLLTRNQPPEGLWADKLTTFFGTREWADAFYTKTGQQSLFDDEPEQIVKSATFDTISQFFVARLDRVFTRVAPNPLPLTNSKNVPIYLLCFAAGNPKGASTAVRIAQHILKPSA
ncbi:MAG: three-Cys-motif partner protein TcmP [Chloroflexaceae bacterium]|nr:three-Cys-motif partner protein TcmP [Chloroflexaceae bacterium]